MQYVIKKDKFTWAGGNRLCYLLVLVGAGVVYWFTCAPTVLWQDSGLFVYRMWHGDIEGNLGLALSHPLYVMFGAGLRYIPVGEFAWRVNFMSGVFGAFALASLFLLLRLWGCRIAAAVVAAITLGISWTFWGHAVIAEAYTLFALQLFLELIVLTLYLKSRKVGYIYLLGFLSGLTIANHMWGIFGLGCYGLFVCYLLWRKEIRVRDLVLFVVSWMIGAGPYEYLIVKNMVVSGDVLGTLASAAFGQGWQNRVMNTSISLKIVLENIIFIALNFPTFNFVFLVIGLWVVRKKLQSRSFANILTALLILHFLFAFRYTVPDRFAFFLPFYCLAAVFSGFGLDWFLRRFKSKPVIAAVVVFAFLPALVYNFTPNMARKVYPGLAQRRQRPYRDEYEYFLKPWKNGYRGAARFAREALESVEKGAVIWAYTTEVHSLLYMQEVMGVRGDVKIISEYDSSVGLGDKDIEQIAAQEDDLYVSTTAENYCPEFLLRHYNFDRMGVLYKATKKRELGALKQD